MRAAISLAASTADALREPATALPTVGAAWVAPRSPDTPAAGTWRCAIAPNPTAGQAAHGRGGEKPDLAVVERGERVADKAVRPVIDSPRAGPPIRADHGVSRRFTARPFKAELPAVFAFAARQDERPLPIVDKASDAVPVGTRPPKEGVASRRFLEPCRYDDVSVPVHVLRDEGQNRAPERAVTLSTVSRSSHFTRRPKGANVSASSGGGAVLGAAAAAAGACAAGGSPGMRKISGRDFFSSLRRLAGPPGAAREEASSFGVSAAATF